LQAATTSQGFWTPAKTISNIINDDKINISMVASCISFFVGQVRLLKIMSSHQQGLGLSTYGGEVFKYKRLRQNRDQINLVFLARKFVATF
jgi:hypothetical protein